jgi:triacylglycerol lipase
MRFLTIILLTMSPFLTSCATTRGAADVAIKVPQGPPKRVVIVHGIFDTKITMIPLRKSLEKAGFQCLIPSLGPADGRAGLEPMAKQLRDAINDGFGPEAPFSIVAFSMGGLVSRHYLQNLGGAARCQGFHSIATPHNGTYTAYLYPGLGTRQMRPESSFLTALNENDGVFDTIPTTSYRTPFDGVIIPSRNSDWDKAENIEIKSFLHPSLLWRKVLHADLIRRLRKESPGFLTISKYGK